MNINKKLALSALILAIFIFVINIFAMRESWYFFIWWFDMPMHSLGGFFIAILTCSLVISKQNYFKNLSLKNLFVYSMISVFVIGFLWEIFELSVEKLVEFADLVSLSDSVSDMFFDMAGGLMGALIGLFVFKKGLKDLSENK